MTPDPDPFEVLFPSPKLEFPSRSGNRSTKSLLLLQEVRGDTSYRKKLDTAASVLTIRAVRLHRKLRPSLKLTYRPAIFNCAKLLLHSLAHVTSNPLRYEYLSISLNRNDYLRDGQFRGLNMDSLRLLLWSLTITEPQLDGEVELYLSEYKGTYNRTGSIPVGMRTRLQPHDSLKNWLCKNSLVMYGHPSAVKRVRSQQLPQYSVIQVNVLDDDKSERERRDLDRKETTEELGLRALTSLVSRTKIGFIFDRYEDYLLGWDFESRKCLVPTQDKTQNFSRIFTDHDGDGGRVYGHWLQSLPKRLRRLVTFDGRSTIELDYVSMQLMLAYSIQNKRPNLEDPYDISESLKIPREVFKAVFTKAIGSDSRGLARSSFANYLRQYFPKLAPKANSILDVFWSAHAEITNLEGVSAWRKLQYLESEIALRVCHAFVLRGRPIIPIHDSFLVDRRDLELLHGTMVAVPLSMGLSAPPKPVITNYEN